MRVIKTDLPGVVLIEPAVFGDPRGFFLETFHAARYLEAGVPGPFVQDNLSASTRGVLRGLHFQHPHGQGKLVCVPQGEVFDVAVDVQAGSPTFARWTGHRLSGENKLQLYIPPGFAHGFCTLSETALFAYKCTDYYNPETEQSVRWNDPEIAIEWPIESPVLSGKDADAPGLAAIESNRLPAFACPLA